MEHTVEKLEGSKVKLTFTVLAAEFESALQKAYLKMRGQINVPGFRKGKAPRKLIEKMFGDKVFYDDALEIMFPDAYTEALEKNDLHPVSRPEVTDEKLEAGQDGTFTCEFFVRPQVKLGEYKGVQVARTIRKVEAAQVDGQIEQERKRVARSVEITDRPLMDGDMAELDYKGTVDGVAFEGGTAEHQTLKIGSGSFIPGFEEQMVGMTVGEEKDLNVKFPEEYHSEDLKGKDAVFHVKLHAITKEELPEADDEFAAEVSDFDTMAEYRADVEKKLQEAADIQADEAAKSSLLDTVVDNAECDIPAPMVEDKLDEMLQDMDWRMRRQGFSMEQYLKMLGQTPAQMRDNYRVEAEKNVKTELVMDEIIKVENVEADDAEVEKLLEGLTVGTEQTAAQMKETLNEEQIAYFTNRAKITKAIDMLWKAAQVTDQEAEADDKPEAEKEADKKPKTAKKTAKKAQKSEDAAPSENADA